MKGYKYYHILFTSLFFMLFGLCPIQTLGQGINLKSSRDSVERLLIQTPKDKGARRLELLKNLYDIGSAIGDTTYIMPLWYEAVRQNDVKTMDDIIVSMAMRYLRRGVEDSVSAWMGRNDSYIPEPLRIENIEYLKLRRDIQDVNKQDELAQNLVKQQVALDSKGEPYRAMRILYSLSLIANRGVGNSPSLKLKPSREYKAEALAIARSLPFEESIHFQGQILLGMSMLGVDYARQFLEFNKRLLDSPHLRGRTFYSRLRILSSLEGLIMVGNEMTRAELDGYYNEIQRLIKQYPYDTPCATDQFNARVNFYYNRSIDNPSQALRWSDSLIAILPKYDLPVHYQKYLRMELLARLARWEEAYKAADEYIVIKDSLYALGTEEKLAELQTQYDVDKLKIEKQQRQQQFTFAVVCCTFLIFTIVILCYFYHQTHRKNLILCERLDALAEAQKQTKQARIDLYAQGNGVYKTDNADNADAVLLERLNELMLRDKLFAQADLSRDSVAAMLHTNRTNLYRCLKDRYNMSFTEYLATLRLEAAVEQLRQSNVIPNMQQLSEDVGYGSYTSFYRAFVKHYGIKPIEYIRFLRNKENSNIPQ